MQMPSEQKIKEMFAAYLYMDNIKELLGLETAEDVFKWVTERRDV